VFVSSTLGELADERRVVRDAVEQLRLTPVMFELGARPHPPRELYRAYLAQSHVFLGLYWERYGWVAPDERISGLEDELRLSTGMPRLLYIKDPAPNREPRLTEMLDGITAAGDVSYRRFSDLDELHRLVEDDLAVLLTERFEAASRLDLASTGDAPPRTPRHRPAAPPVPLTPTVGRDADIDRVVGLLRGGVRLLTLSGAGGIGKSRLALEVARRLTEHFEDGIVFVPLESVTEPEQLLRTVAERLDVADTGARPVLEALVDHLAEQRVLLLLDNFEQVCAAAPDLGALLDRCPAVSALVTSRQLLRLRAEHDYPVSPLATPTDATDTAIDTAPAVELFVQRATAARPDFEVTAANRPTIAELSRRLDGLPLAIELAAARVRLLPPDALLERLEHRLDLLTGGASDLPERQRTLRATLDWSYRLLDPAEQRLLARLSVFARGATLDAVEAICGDDFVADVIGTLSSLLEKSLLVSADADAGLPRLRLLQVVRDYAWERLAEFGETDDLRRRHADWYVELTRPADPAEFDDAVRGWPILEAEADNLRAAAAWCVESRDVLQASRLATRTWCWAWLTGRLGETREWLDAVLPLTRDDADPETTGKLSYVAANVRFMSGDLTTTLATINRAIELFEESGPDINLAASRMTRATILVGSGRLDEAADDASYAVEVANEAGHGWLLGYASSIRGSLRMLTGDLVGARSDHEQSFAAADRIDLDVLRAQAVGQLVWVDLLEGRLDDAAHGLATQIDFLQQADNHEGLGYALDALAALALARQRPAEAATAFTAAAEIRERIRIPAWPMLGVYHDTYVTIASEELGDRADSVIAGARGRDPWQVAHEVLAAVAAPSPATTA
jgi:predicted ATPase